MIVTIEKQITQPCFQLKSSRVTCMAMELHFFDEKAITEQIDHLLSQAPQCLKNAPVVLSLDKCKKEPTAKEIHRLYALCKSYGICLFAFRGGSETLNNAARNAGLIQLPNEKSTRGEREADGDAPAETKARISLTKESQDSSYADKTKSAKSDDSHLNSDHASANRHQDQPEYRVIPSRIITEPVRSGQQIYHPGELIVLAPVSAGAELVSESNIHVYNVLRGKALAGVNGNDHARIFCSQFQSELISINGHYKTASDIPSTQVGHSVQIWLHEGCLHITPLSKRQ